MKDVLISIKPVFVNKILIEEKKFEFRKKNFSSKVRNIVIYSSSPKQKMVGYFNYTGVISGTPKEVWDKCKNHSGIDESDYFNYFRDKSVAFAIKIEKIETFRVEINPKEIWKNFIPPQSFYYLKEGEFDEVFCNLV